MEETPELVAELSDELLLHLHDTLQRVKLLTTALGEEADEFDEILGQLRAKRIKLKQLNAKRQEKK